MREKHLPFVVLQGETTSSDPLLHGKHGPVTSSTVARCIKTCLQKAGIDTSKFQAHSVRAATASTAAMSGLSVEDILKAADWSSESVF